MRELRFRAWNKLTSEMLQLGWGWVNDHGYILGEDSNSANHDELIYMQWTGLIDKNEKDIYEGDIVNIGFTYIEPCIVKYEKMINPDRCEKHKNGVGIHWVVENNKKELYWISSNYEVIGNIYENPKLMKE